MDEAAGRLILAGGLALAAVLAAGAGHLLRRQRSDRAAAAPLDLSGIAGRVLFFSAPDCASCDLARRRLRAVGVEVVEVGYAERPDLHRAAGVTAVPLIVVRDAGGVETGRIAGAPGRLRLRRLVRRAGIEMTKSSYAR